MCQSLRWCLPYADFLSLHDVHTVVSTQFLPDGNSLCAAIKCHSVLPKTRENSPKWHDKHIVVCIGSENTNFTKLLLKNMTRCVWFECSDLCSIGIIYLCAENFLYTNICVEFHLKCHFSNGDWDMMNVNSSTWIFRMLCEFRRFSDKNNERRCLFSIQKRMFSLWLAMLFAMLIAFIKNMLFFSGSEKMVADKFGWKNFKLIQHLTVMNLLVECLSFSVQKKFSSFCFVDAL